MESVKLDKQRGQILVTVAIMAVAIFAFVALAVDVGQIYGGRRRMQNAADAGALGGAYEICFGDRATYEDTALDYAEANGAVRDDTIVELYGDTIVVEARSSVNTFFAGAIGIHSAEVGAEAAAHCGPPVVAGGLWPLAFEEFAFDKVCDLCEGEDEDATTCPFWLFTNAPGGGGGDSDYDARWECVTDCEDVPHEERNLKYLCSEADLPPGDFGPVVDTANRGWLRLWDPHDTDSEYEYDDPCQGKLNCGQNYVNCWLEYPHPGPVQEGDCIVAKPGVGGFEDKGKHDSDSEEFLRIIEESEGEIRHIPLWDRICGEGDPEPRACDGDEYHISAFGCIEIGVVHDRIEIEKCNGDVELFSILTVRAICDATDHAECRDLGGTTPGGEDVRRSQAVSLIPVPPRDP